MKKENILKVFATSNRLWDSYCLCI